MTFFIDALRISLGSDAFASRVNAADVVVTIALMGLLVEHQMLRAHAERPEARRWPRTAILIAPLTVLFSIIVVARAASLLT